MEPNGETIYNITQQYKVCRHPSYLDASYGSNSCNRCALDYYSLNGFCKPCPHGYIFVCPEGRFNNASQCVNCHASYRTCSGAKDNNCTLCDAKAYLSAGKCIDCPSNAEWNGSAFFTCYAGYSKIEGECVKDEQEATKTNTVNSCPSRMTLSSDGCCCINK